MMIEVCTLLYVGLRLQYISESFKMRNVTVELLFIPVLMALLLLKKVNSNHNLDVLLEKKKCNLKKNQTPVS